MLFREFTYLAFKLCKILLLLFLCLKTVVKTFSSTLSSARSKLIFQNLMESNYSKVVAPSVHLVKTQFHRISA